MKNKIFALLLALVMAIGTMPVGALAVKTTVDNTMERNPQSGATPRMVENQMDYLKQMFQDNLDVYYNGAVQKQSYYCKAVWKELNNIYNAERKRIQKAKKVGDLSSSKHELALERIESLGMLTLQTVKGKGDLKRLQQELKEDLKYTKTLYNQADYNSYYWSVYQDREAEISSQINKITSKGTFTAYADARSAVEDFFPEDDDEFSIIFDDDVDEPDPIIDFLGEWIYKKSELAEIRANLVNAVRTYVKSGLKQKGYKGSTKQFDRTIEQFQKDLERIPVAETLAEKYTAVLQTIDKKAKIKNNQTPPTDADIIRILDKMEAVYIQNYQERNYSFTGWSKLERIYNQAIANVYEITAASQLKNSLVTSMKKKMDKVPTLKEELTKIRTKAIARLKKYLKNKKYDQKKVKPIVQKGVTAIKKCKDPDDVEELYWKYSVKAENAILKFKVTAKKKGKGTISKTKTVKYGGACTIKLTPNPGHRIKSVFIDGKRTKLRNSYSFKNVKKAHKIVAIFQ